MSTKTDYLELFLWDLEDVNKPEAEQEQFDYFKSIRNNFIKINDDASRKNESLNNLQMTETNITTTEEITSYEIADVKEIYMEGSLLIENKHYTKTDTTVSFLFTVPADTEITFKCGGGTSEN